jgi:acyl-CoA thioester hydrolase
VKGFAYTTRVRVLWGDLDALGHVNNTRFFRWFEQARIEYFEKLGESALSGKNTVGPILAHASCDYMGPVRYPADLEVGVRVIKTGETSVAMEYAVAAADAPDTALARGASVVVMIDYATMQKVRVPDEMRARIEALEATRA